MTTDIRPAVTVRRARTSDVPAIQALVEPLVQRRILLGKDAVVFYEAVQEFRVAEDADGRLVGCGALHVFWEDLGEVRTLAVHDDFRGRGVGRILVDRLEQDALELGLSRLFCLTFEVPFFERQGYTASPLSLVDPEVYAELVRSPDEGVAEFLDLARVKPNTLGNTRMLKHLR
ncbi:amino-acid N-acetyltransferase [Humibacter sp. BT305]|uniref:N-acetylglutamate synthase n=1 Tax=Cnuibacter physcomitrellae TaxID=1619308 RepID=A0A1X9LKQ7_9MICO|nr:amino-acid N-acetyltransferase [Cnuibacter physcomitrellae]ARJ04521.1 N-acetylglutamate synthase [Cnuibacter physcomitrellae]AXH36825.1 amino-acid N-acetyltransferase [Humibacter sp. BT305]MCS5498966.1 amino-acid N-acetyltransferase [Cnuibacter physcomitrellae]GGI41246.1 N-acetylglutamate synthase [Cnuibacter physcomitrellae]